MSPGKFVVLKRAILMLILLICAVTVAGIAFGLWERFHTEPRVDIRGKKELSLIEREHVARYEFAKPYCAGRTVADIASGTGFGMDILRTVAKSVDGYDLEPLGQQFVIDLEKQAWSRSYDVIVSFETIEHLSNPEFFLGNVKKSARTLILSAPLNERLGWTNPYHKQVWTDGGIKRLLRKFF